MSCTYCGSLRGQRFFLQLKFAPPNIEREGGLTAFLTKLSVDFQVGDRVIPFVSGGGGTGRLSEEISFDFDGRNDVTDVRLQIGQGIGGRRPLILPPDDITRSETGLTLTVEGGLDVLLWKGFSIGADGRLLRLLVDRGTFDFAQIISRVSVRF
jgi:opacity protein-like surface antigen